MEVSATVDGFLQPSKPHLHVLLLPPTSCHPVFLLIIVAAHTSLIKTSYKSYGHLVILVIGRGNIETILGVGSLPIIPGTASVHLTLTPP